MLHDRIVDNKEIGRKIWKVCIVFSNNLYSVERYVLRWMICTTLNDMYYVEWFVLRWVIFTTLKDLNCVEWFVHRWMICTALNYLQYSVEWLVLRWMIFITLNDFLLRSKICITSNDLYSVERFILRWMIRNALDDLYNVESFELRWITEYRLFNECQVCLFKKILSDILHQPLGWFFPDLAISRGNIFGNGHIEIFLITLVETIINVFSRYI